MFEERRQLADLMADRDAPIKRMARAARDKAAALGTLVEGFLTSPRRRL